MDLNHLCMGCMREIEGQMICPHCGYDASVVQPAIALPVKTVLQKRYIVGRMLDQNGEGIGYIGYDTVLSAPVYLREFLPENLAARVPHSAQVSVITGCEVAFGESCRAFLSYFRKVARMRELAALIPIYDIFEENNTAYTVSEWLEHITLRDFVERSGGHISWDMARPLFMPVLSTLSAMHSAGVRHLGICPENLFILRSGKMRLGGFGIHAVRQADTDLKPQLFAGCAAIEQYVMDYTPDESTDVYGFTASLFYALTGTLPQDSLKRRTDGRLLIPTSIVKTIPPHVVTALANGLQVKPEKRTPTFERLRAELSAAPSVTMVQKEVQAPPVEPPRSKAEQKAGKKTAGVPNYVWGIISCVICLALFTLIAVFWMQQDGGGSVSSDSVSSAASSSSAVSSAASEDPDLFPIPNLVGQNYEEAKAQAQADGRYRILLDSESEDFSETIPEGCILSQTPQFSEEGKMKTGSAIAVKISKGPKMRELPPIEGLSLTEASEKISAAGFVPQKYEQDGYSDTVPVGMVIGYYGYQAGEKLEYGSTVQFVLSRGAAPGGASEATE
jgi:serine/threonine protein kinase